MISRIMAELILRIRDSAGQRTHWTT